MRYPIFLTVLTLTTLITTHISAQWKTGPFSISFETRNAGFRVIGTIYGLDLSFTTDETGSIPLALKGSVDTKTLTTHNRTRDSHLLGSDYFDADKYPKIYMESTSIKSNLGDNYMGNFSLKIKDKTRMIRVPFQFKTISYGKEARLSGQFRMNRRDFGVGGGSLILSDSITVKMDIRLIK